MTHLTFEEINDLADLRDLSGEQSAHLAECEVCRSALERLRGLIARARALPGDVDPPPEVWDAVHARLRAAPRPSRPATPWWHNGWLATAAAIVLVFGTATFMTLMSRGKPTKAKAMLATTPSPAASALFVVDRNYAGTIRDLRAALEEERDRLSPETVKTVDRSLEVIDAAIAEARAALAADPANQALTDILAAHYERQVDLLQRATELSPSL